MSEQSQKSRFAIDLDDLERQLRSSSAQDVRQPQADPLAELTRLVGQDDPFKDMFSPSQTGASTPSQTRHEPFFADTAQRYAPHVQPVQQAESDVYQQPEFQVPQDELRGALDEFDAIFDRKIESGETAQDLHEPMAHDAAAMQNFRDAGQDQDAVSSLDDMISRDLDQILQENRQPLEAKGYDAAPPFAAGAAMAGVVAGTVAMAGAGTRYAQPDMHDVDDAANDMPPQRRRFGKGAMTAAVLVAIGLGGVGAAALWRGGGKTAGGEPPVIKADAGPTKVQPQNPGGADIPDQNKQIYERSTTPTPADTKIVSREEQPVDVQAAARSAARVVFPGPTTGAATNPSSASPDTSSVQSAPNATSALGEPRKVRTVLVRPDGTIAGAGGTAAPVTQTAATPLVTSQTSSTPSTAAPSAPAIIRQQAPKPAVPVLPRTVSPETTASAPLSINPPVAAARPAAPLRVAAAPAAQPADAPAASGSGNFTVQLGAPGSDEEARSLFSSLQRRYPEELGGQRPIIRKADVGGREVHRLRVGPLSSNEATELCNKLKTRGGQCFIARS